MVKPIHIILSAEWETESNIPKRVLNRCRFLLPGAQMFFQQAPHSSILEQWYDTPDAFIQLINVSTEQKLRVPFYTARYDLYAFHTLAGSSFWIEPDKGELYGSGIHLEQGHYRLSYLPPASYHAHFEAGDYLIFFFVIKPSLLFREYSPELHIPAVDLFTALQQRLSSMQVSTSRRIPQPSLQRIIQYLRDPGKTYLQRLEAMQGTLIYLLRQYLGDLQLLHLQHQSDTQIIEQVKTHIKNSIADGAPFTPDQLAGQSGLALSFLKPLFAKHEQISLSHYIVQEKLILSRHLLRGGMPVAQVATYLCWHPSHFRRIFKLYHRITPQAFQQQADQDQK